MVRLFTECLVHIDQLSKLKKKIDSHAIVRVYFVLLLVNWHFFLFPFNFLFSPLFSLALTLALFFFFWSYPSHTEVPLPGIESVPQQWPEPQQWECQILNPLSYQGTPSFLLSFFLFVVFLYWILTLVWLLNYFWSLWKWRVDSLASF